MLTRLEFLTVRPPGLECFAAASGKFAGRPEGDGRVFRGSERGPPEGRDVLPRGVLRAVAALDPPLQHAGVDAGARRAAPRDLSLRRGRLGPGAPGRRD